MNIKVLRDYMKCSNPTFEGLKAYNDLIIELEDVDCDYYFIKEEIRAIFN